MTGEKLNQILTDRGIKQSWVASKLGVTKQTVNQWVKGTTPISSERAEELKRIFPN